MKERWYILGAGSIGNLWACNLVSAGFPVTLILRNSAKLSRFKANNGIQLADQMHSCEAELADDSSLIPQLIITTKSTDTQTAFNSIKHRLADDAHVVVLQNGMGSQQWITDQLPNAEVAWASTTDGAWLESEFSVVHAGKGVTRIGSPDKALDWLEQLNCGFLDLQPDPEIATTLWRKLAINCAINPLTASFDCKNGELVSNPNYLNEMVLICNEVEKVVNALNLELFDGPLIDHACQVAELTANNFSSMNQDVKHGRITEINQITGYLCEQADKLDITVDINKYYLEKIRELHPHSNT
ncbi:2-dehydropantoate 2-reductase [Neptuniibacter sp. QD48_55]|uniref:2-dehydropantoate 2-reductase n=1 Tax=Neptuniibacter sp. QD48_55 TaxID=3398212 RepID=UPI0039F5A324